MNMKYEELLLKMRPQGLGMVWVCILFNWSNGRSDEAMLV
jgi:hypothetical protein